LFHIHIPPRTPILSSISTPLHSTVHLSHIWLWLRPHIAFTAPPHRFLHAFQTETKRNNKTKRTETKQ
jgi:hypothetical protein